MKRYLSFILFFLLYFPLFAQQAMEKPEMAEGLYASGKIYVVIVVALVILLGIFLYLMILDHRIKRLEDKDGPLK